VKPVTPILAADGFVRDADGRVLLIKRKNPPDQGSWALPGGFVDVGEDPRDACEREMREETGLVVEVERVAGFYGRPDRDPRGHTASITYACRVVSGEAKGGDDAAEARWFRPDELSETPLAFDHRDVLAELLEGVRYGRSRKSTVDSRR
jgi:8-oxo-dGTP diphosphatase